LYSGLITVESLVYSLTRPSTVVKLNIDMMFYCSYDWTLTRVSTVANNEYKQEDLNIMSMFSLTTVETLVSVQYQLQ
jgi:hypothetical protein